MTGEGGRGLELGEVEGRIALKYSLSARQLVSISGFLVFSNEYSVEQISQQNLTCHPEQMRKGLVPQSLTEEEANAEILSLRSE